MKRTRRVTITKVHRQTVTVTTTSVVAHCPICQCQVETVTHLEAAAVLQAAGRILDAAIASGQVHVIPVPNGSSRVCKNSLFAV